MEEILHQLIGSSSHYLHGFMHPRWCRISSINNINSFHEVIPADVTPCHIFFCSLSHLFMILFPEFLPERFVPFRGFPPTRKLHPCKDALNRVEQQLLEVGYAQMGKVVTFDLMDIYIYLLPSSKLIYNPHVSCEISLLHGRFSSQPCLVYWSVIEVAWFFMILKFVHDP